MQFRRKVLIFKAALFGIPLIRALRAHLFGGPRNALAFWGKGETIAVLFVICEANYIGTEFVSMRVGKPKKRRFKS